MGDSSVVGAGPNRSTTKTTKNKCDVKS